MPEGRGWIFTFFDRRFAENTERMIIQAEDKANEE